MQVKSDMSKIPGEHHPRTTPHAGKIGFTDISRLYSVASGARFKQGTGYRAEGTTIASLKPSLVNSRS